MKRAFSRKHLWEKTPALLKSTLGRGLGLIPPAWLFGIDFRKNHSFLKEAQSWSSCQNKEYQFDKLREILKIAFEKSRFYHRSFISSGFDIDNFRSLEDMHRIPIIDKEDVIKNLSDMCMKSVLAGDVEHGTTAGTSGIPLRFYMNVDRSAIEYSHLVNSWERAGFKLGMPMAVLRGRVVKTDRNGFHHEYDPILRHHYYSSFHMSDENMARYLDHIATIGPCFMHVYPSNVVALARFILRNSLKAPQNIMGIIAESEIVYPEQRQMVEKVFGCCLFSCYGQSEKIVLATGCEKSDNYHVWPTYGYFELLDEDGHPVKTPGQRGEIVGTGFINTVMPFIRYRTGDWATYIGDRCPECGREHIIIRDIRGHRTQEVLIASDGSEISWTALNMHDDTFISVRQFQFFQEVPGKAVLRVIPTNGFGREDTLRIQRNLGRKLDSRLIFDIKLVDTIDLSPRGKAIYVDQRIPKEDKLPSNPANN